jgi:HSP20 family protein
MGSTRRLSLAFVILLLGEKDMALSSERHVKTIEEPLDPIQVEEAAQNTLERFQQDMREVGLNMERFENRLMNLMYSPLPRTMFLPRWYERITPPVDIEETPTTYLVKTNLPGVPKDKIEVRFWGQSMDVKAEVSPEKEVATKNYLYRERTEASYHRRVRFPTAIVPEKTEALLEDGILTVSVPKLEPGKEHRIRVR